MKRTDRRIVVRHPVRRRVKVFSRISRRSRSLWKKLSALPVPGALESNTPLKGASALLLNHEPMRFARRIILRRQAGRIPPKRFDALNMLYIKSAKRANMLLAILTRQLDPTDDIAIKCRNLIQTNFAGYE